MIASTRDGIIRPTMEERVSFPPQLDDRIIITKCVNNIDRYCMIFSIVRRYLSGDGFTEADHKTRHCTIQIIPVKRAFPRRHSYPTVSCRFVHPYR